MRGSPTVFSICFLDILISRTTLVRQLLVFLTYRRINCRDAQYFALRGISAHQLYRNVLGRVRTITKDAPIAFFSCSDSAYSLRQEESFDHLDTIEMTSDEPR